MERTPESTRLAPASSSSAELMEAAREAERSRGHASNPRERYASARERFARERSMDALGFRQAVEELSGPAGIIPPRPDTLRGRMGRWMVNLQARSLWWVARAFRLHARALEAAYQNARAEHRRVTELEERYAADRADWEKRLRALEGRAGEDDEG